MLFLLASDSGHAFRCMFNLLHQEVDQTVPTPSTQICAGYICIKLLDSAKLFGTVP
jgi:hypothetical protein